MADATLTRRKDFLSILDFDAADLERCLQLAAQVKADRSLGRHAPTTETLNGRHVAMLAAASDRDGVVAFYAWLRSQKDHLPIDVAAPQESLAEVLAGAPGVGATDEYTQHGSQYTQAVGCPVTS